METDSNSRITALF